MGGTAHPRLTADIIELARQYGRYGYRKVAELLRQAGWIINDKRVERIWRREGLKVPPKQPKRGRLWLADGSCIRLRPQQRNHVWSYDFVNDRTHDGRKYRMLNVLDEFTHECLAIRVARKLKAIDVIDVLSDLFILRGIPVHIRSDNGPEFVAKAVQGWIAAVGAKTAYIERGSPWENGYIESFNARLRDELLNGEIFYTLREAELTDGLGDSYATRSIMLKRFPCHITAHTSVQAILDLRTEHGYAAADVASIHIAGNDKMARVNNIASPADIMMAQYSIPFCVALAHVRDPRDPRSFDESALREPQIRSLAERVTITIAKERPTPLAALVTVKLKDGRVLTRCVADFKGTPAQPLDQGELREKFLLLTRHCSGEYMGDMFYRLQNLERESNLDWIGVRPQ